jgi:hypothetical protein
MPVTVSQASRLTGRSRNTLIRAIKAGKLAAPRGENGDYAIDQSELGKIFPLAGPSTDRLEAEIETLKARLKEAMESRDDARRDRDDWKAQADAWRQQAERLTLIAEPKAKG